MKIYLASGNEHKRKEFQELLSDHTVVLPKDEGGVFEPEETGATFFENAMIKAKALFNMVHAPVFADDSGLCIEALNGAPGIYSARYGSVNNKNSSPEIGIQKILSELDGIENRKAYFVCCIAVYLGRERFYAVQETCCGEISIKPSGCNGFGYDPIFFLPQFQKTMSEITTAQKNIISHRAKAARLIAELLK